MAKGGLYLSFSDGTNTTWVLRDTDNQLANSDATQVSWHNRTIPLDSYAGKTIAAVTLVSDCCVSGAWLIQYRDLVLLYADGSVKPIFTGGTSAPLSAGSMWATSGISGLGFQAFRSLGEWASYQTTTTYYHGDHLGSAQMMTGAEGWPVWSATYLPFGYEFNASGSPPTHYKFTGKERDSESGLDYFGARYYTNGLGRWISPDWAAAPTGVPYADFANPQSLNLYGYVGNAPINRVDKDGHCPQCIGAIIGAGAGALTVLIQTTRVVSGHGGHIPTNREIAGAIIGGAIGGAIGTGGGGGILTNLVTKGGVQVAKATLTQTALQSGVGGVAGGVANRAVSTGDANKALDPKAVATDGALSVGARLLSAPLTSGSTVAQNANSLANQYASPNATGAAATANLAVGDTARSMAAQATNRSAETGAIVKTGTAAFKQAVKGEKKD